MLSCPTPHLPAATAVIWGGWRFLAPPPPLRSWESLQYSPRPDVSDPSETKAKLLHTLHLPVTPLITKAKGFHWSQ